jgi:TorA maturation chaperone TorD
LARAVVWRFVSLGFAPPSAALRRALEDESERLGLEIALDRLGLPPFRCEPPPDLEDVFGGIFGHTLRSGPCPYETEYGGAHVFQQAQELADLQGWYAAFGLERRSDGRERVDHIGCECEFVGFLATKEAYLLERRDDEQLERVRQAYRRFLRDHLGRFGTAVTTRLEKLGSPGFYGDLATLCRTFLASECRRVGVRPGPRALPLRPEEPDVPAACGASDDGEPPSPDLLSITRGE